MPHRLKALALSAFLILAPAMAAADNIAVVLDQARILKLPDRVATIVIGNPAIADATLQANGLLVVTGKGYGATNLMALDSKGVVLAEHMIRVSAPTNGTVTVYRGPDRETLSCAPNCQRTLVPGDASAVFDAVVAQNGTRNGLAAGANAAAPAGR